MCSVDYNSFGQQSDSGTFVGSHFGQAFQNGMLNIPAEDVLPDTNTVIPYVLLGD